jgi:Ser/Thr protein kinase RdoA (MazF antagonist)
VSESSIAAVLSHAPPPVTDDDAEVLLKTLWGIEGRASALTSERDQNFRIDARDGRRFVLKLTHPSEDRAVTNFQTGALRHIEQVAPQLPVPRVVPTLAGELEHERSVNHSAPRLIRLMTWLEGTPLNQLEQPDLRLRHELGRSLAELGRALRGYFHPAAGHELLWDLKQAAKLEPLLDHIPDDAQRALADKFMQRFLDQAAPALPGLRAQVVHNDLNFFNVMVEAQAEQPITGIIDFGDMVHTPLVCDLAVAAAYQLSPGQGGLQQLQAFVSGYRAVTALEPEELDLLPVLIATRCLMTVAITGWRAARHPENRDYILRNNPAAWQNLAFLDELGLDTLRAALDAPPEELIDVAGG